MQFNPKSGEWLSMNAPMPIRTQEPSQTPIPQPERKLSFVLPFIEKEINHATSFLLRSFDLCGQIPRNLFLVPFKGIKFDMVHVAAKQAFGSVGVIHDAEGKTSDWQKGEKMRDASGPNTFFRQAAWFFYLNKRFPMWLWLEPDCTPITNDWWFQLENEYLYALSIGKQFVGAKMRMPDGKEYMNGVGVYPWNSIQFEPLLVQSTMWKQFPNIEAAFDVAGGQKILDHAHITKKIQLELARKDEVKIRPETVLIHGRNNLVTNVQEDLSGETCAGSRKACSNTPATHIGAETQATQPTQNTSEKQWKDGFGVTTRSIPATPHNPNHAPSQAKQDGYGGVVKQIRKSVQELVNLNLSPSRKVLIVKELRRAKLVPKHFR